jgi:phosphoglycolate phosphatase
MTNKLIIFDFDGTIADTLDTLLKITNRLALEFGYVSATQEEFAQIKNLSSREIIKQSGISIFKLPFLLRRVEKELKREVKNINLILGIKEALIELQNQGNQLGIVTSNSEENARLILQQYEMQELFDFIYSGTTLFGKHRIINKLLRQRNLQKNEVIYVGDETRDIESAQKSKIKIVSVSWGFNTPEILASYNPDFLIHHPRELIEIIASLQGLGEVPQV